MDELRGNLRTVGQRFVAYQVVQVSACITALGNLHQRAILVGYSSHRSTAQSAKHLLEDAVRDGTDGAHGGHHHILSYTYI